MSLIKDAFLLIVLQLFSLNRINCGGTGEIQFLNYTDSADCVDVLPEVCDFYFKNILIENEDGNELHVLPKTDDIGNSVKVNLSRVDELGEAFAVNFTAKKRITISIKVSGNEERAMTDLVVPFSNTTVKDGWVKQDYRSQESKGTLTIQYRLTKCDDNFTGLGCDSCEDSYFTPQCDKYCKPKPGYFKCNSSGEKVCEGRRRGQNCDSCTSFYFGHDCKTNCEPADEYYMCSESGHKICLDNTTSVANNCRESKNTNLGMTVVVGSGSLIIVLVMITGFTLLLRRQRRGRMEEGSSRESAAHVRTDERVDCKKGQAITDNIEHPIPAYKEVEREGARSKQGDDESDKDGYVPMKNIRKARLLCESTSVRNQEGLNHENDDRLNDSKRNIQDLRSVSGKAAALDSQEKDFTETDKDGYVPMKNIRKSRLLCESNSVKY
ncbi:uncharacterized protein LOC134812939 [Bolinopsis microptera]|uniref:uncharacterized protein LOC134812939 n=1 Tax=Bolinopsis microptera TaxID=2820187 RepID=UPI0030798563